MACSEFKSIIGVNQYQTIKVAYQNQFPRLSGSALKVFVRCVTSWHCVVHCTHHILPLVYTCHPHTVPTTFCSQSTPDISELTTKTWEPGTYILPPSLYTFHPQSTPDILALYPLHTKIYKGSCQKHPEATIILGGHVQFSAILGGALYQFQHF